MTAVATRSATSSKATSRSKPARTSTKTRNRLAAGALFVLIGVLVNLAIYRGVNHKTSVLQLSRDVPAGEQIVAADFRTVAISADGAFRSVPLSDEASVIGQYAKVRLVAGSLLAREGLQTNPLVQPGASVVAVVVPTGEVPAGVRERSRVSLVLVAADKSTNAVPGQVVGLPTVSSSSSGQTSLSVEVAAADAVNVAGADKVRVVLLDPVVTP